MELEKTAIILLDYRNNQAVSQGLIRDDFDETSDVTGVLENIVALLKDLRNALIISTPIIFTEEYRELDEPVGLLNTIADMGAFKMRENKDGTRSSMKRFGDSIIEIPSQQSLNAFVHTDLEKILKKHAIEDVLLAGTACSICLDWMGQFAVEKGFKVTMISDCISGRTFLEQEFYFNRMYPLNATVMDSKSVLKNLHLERVTI
ncbi:MAG: isochorismatase family protein [Flavobacteriales bacterium]|nr:isochorismatase family protein [Flavobacteriales bacterium]